MNRKNPEVRPKSSRTERILLRAVPLAWAVACFCFFQANFKFHFYYIEKNQLFIPTGDCLAAFFEKPAWLSCMAGEFLQQFYHYLCAGPAILTAVLLGLGAVSYKTLRLMLSPIAGGKKWIPFILSLSIMTVMAGAYMYENAMLSAVISLAAGMLCWSGYRRIPGTASGLNAAVRTMVFIIIGLLCWWMSGFGLPVMIVCELLDCLVHRRIPYAGVVTAVLLWLMSATAADMYRMDRRAVLTYPGLGKWIDYKIEKRVERLLTYEHVYERGDYKTVAVMYEHEKMERTREMAFYYSLSLSRLGVLPDRLPSMKKPELGVFVHLGENASLPVTRLMGEFYYLIGDMTYAERVCLHANNFSLNKRSASLIKRLAEINLVMEDYGSAAKYLRMLHKSPVYRKWAEEHTPETMTEPVRKYLEMKRSCLNRGDEVRVGDECRQILTGLLDSNRENVTALDYLLCMDILAGRKDLLQQDFEKYGPREKNLYRRLLDLPENENTPGRR